MGELNRNELEGLVEKMADTAEVFFNKDNVIENFGSHGEFLP